jgi:hypothetical protein
MAESPAILPAGLLLVGLGASAAYAIIGPRLGGGTARRGAIFGALAWLLMVPWFEFYLPYNVMREPLALAILEAFLWALALQVVSQAVAWTDRALARRSP